MDPTAVTAARSVCDRPDAGDMGLDSLQFNEEILRLMNLPQEGASSFTALLELPATQAVELLHSTDPSDSPAIVAGGEDLKARFPFLKGMVTFPSDATLIERAARLSVSAGELNTKDSPDTSSAPSNSSANVEKVKSEPAETESSQPLLSDPTTENHSQRAMKRKEREKKVKSSTKKSKSSGIEKISEDAEKLPYIHVRARRGQATDSHSLAERARREKINARMKLLQELVPGCSKISGTALVLDEIINHVQSLQRQVEFLSMRLAAANPRIDFNLDSILAAESESPMDGNIPGMLMHMTWPEVQINDSRHQYQQQWQFDSFHQPVWGRERDHRHHNIITPDNSHLSYDSSANSAALHSNQVKMEL